VSFAPNVVKIQQRGTVPLDFNNFWSTFMADVSNKAVGNTKAKKGGRVQTPVVDRVKAQLTTAVLRNSVKAEDLNALQEHIRKLAAILA
jgi:hypothetical protein